MPPESSQNKSQFNPARYIKGLNGEPCPKRITSMMAVLIACLLAVGSLSETLSYNTIFKVTLPMLLWGFSAEVLFVVERAKQPPSYGGPPGATTDHEGHPSTLRVKYLFCTTTACVLALGDGFFVANHNVLSSPFGMMLCFIGIPGIAKGLLCLIERPSRQPPVPK